LKTSRLIVLLVALFFIFIGSSVTVLAAGIDTSLYENDKAKKTRGINGSDLQDTAIKALQFVGGWGGIVFTMAFMILAMMLGSGGINPYKRSKVYVGLVTVAIAAFLFFSAWQFAPAIANLALSKS
jgi:amino acid transporter